MSGAVAGWCVMAAVWPALVAVAVYLVAARPGARFLPTDGGFDRAVQAAVAVLVTVVVLLVPAGLAVHFAGVVSCARQAGLTPQDLAVGEWREDTRKAFAALPDMLPRLAAAGDDFSAPAWQEAWAVVEPKLGGPTRFGRDVRTAVVAWGHELLARRGEAGTDAAAARAALARVAGADDLPARIDRFQSAVAALPVSALHRSLDRAGVLPHSFIRTGLLLHVYYPSDDLAYLAFADGFREPERKLDPAANPAYWTLGLVVVVFGLFVSRGMKLLTVRFLGAVLVLRSKPAFQEYEAEAFRPAHLLAGVGLGLALALALAAAAVEPFHVLTHRSGFVYGLAAVWNTLVGGVLVESLGHVVAVALVRVGIDPLRTVWDNAAVAAAAVGLFLYVQNSWAAITAALALGVAQSLALKALARRRRAG